MSNPIFSILAIFTFSVSFLGLKSWAKITERRGVSYGNKILMNILLNLKNKPEALNKGKETRNSLFVCFNILLILTRIFPFHSFCLLQNIFPFFIFSFLGLSFFFKFQVSVEKI